MPRRKKRENLMIKFRVIPQRRMTVGEAKRLLMDTLRTGMVQEGIEIRWMDWEKGIEGVVRGNQKFRDGQIPKRKLEDMREFFGALRMASGDLRVERA